MSDQPKITDKTAWKRVGNTALFFVGWICFSVWVFNVPWLQPNRHPVPHQVSTRHVTTNPAPNTKASPSARLPVPEPGAAPKPAAAEEISATPAEAKHLGPFATWMLHWGLILIAIPCLLISGRNFFIRKWKREALEKEERDEQRDEQRDQAIQTAPLNQLSGRRLRGRNKDKGKKKEPQVIEINGKKITVPEMLCDVGTLILPNDPRFAGKTFADVIGQEEAKQEIEEFLDFLKNRKRYERLHAKLPKGLLMHGTHGVGKTLIARILAAISGLPMIEIAGSEFDEMFIGVGGSRVRLLFDDIDAFIAAFGGCILFIDEFDALAKQRGMSAGSGGEGDKTLNQFLKEMDGIIERPELFCIAATNRKDILDPAAIRPGRFDRDMEFYNPTKKDRKAMLELYIPEDIRAPGLDFMHGAKGSASASGAHMANIANEAKIMAARANLDAVTQKILDEAVQKVMFGARRDSRRDILSPEELDTIKVHEGGHALLYIAVNKEAPLRFTTIPRGQSGGHVAFPDGWEMLKTEEQFKRFLIVAMGGWAATFHMRNGQQDTGVGMDIQMATQTAVDMVTKHGMSKKLGPINLGVLEKAGLVSDAFKAQVVDEVTRLVQEAKEEAFRIIGENIDDLKLLVAEVDERETLIEEDFARFMPKLKVAQKEPVPATVSNEGGAS